MLSIPGYTYNVSIHYLMLSVPSYTYNVSI